MRNSLLKTSLGLAASLGFGCATVFGGHAVFTLDTQPTNGPTVSDFWLTAAGGAGPSGVNPGTWVPSLGAFSATNQLFTPTIGQTNSGFITLTTGTGQTAAILFPDFDKGLVVAGFDFKCMIKCGDWTSSDPADGFSVCYVRAEDPIVATVSSGTDPGRGGDANTPGWAGSISEDGNEYNLPEEGTKTGISVGFDTWGNTGPGWPAAGGVTCSPNNSPNAQPFGGANGNSDIRGLDVRVDGVLVAQVCMPNAIPWGQTNTYSYITDATSMFTGPQDIAADGTILGDGALLNWVPLEVKVDTNGVLNVWWKGSNVIANLQTTFYPSAGRVLFGASTGGADEFAGVDNIQVDTIPSSVAIFAGASANYAGYTFKFDNSGTSIVDTNTIQVTIDGTNTYSAAQMTSITVDTNGLTTAMLTTFPPNLLPSGSVHTIDASFKDTAGDALSRKGVKVTVAPYSLLPSSFALPASAVNTNLPGFLVRAVQTQLDRNWNNNGKSDSMLFGEQGPNYANTSMQTDNGYMDETNVIDYPSGSVPGIDVPASTGAPHGPNAATDDIALGATTVLYLPVAGQYTFGVNSDDGFRLYAGTNLLDRLQQNNIIVGEFNGGRGRSDTIFRFIVTKAGYYPFRLTYENGTGGYGFNWFSVNADNSQTDINNLTNPVPIAAYRLAAQGDTYIKSVVPGVGSEVYNPTGGVQIVVADGSANKYVSGSAKMILDGTDVSSSLTVTDSGSNHTVKYSAPPFQFLSTHSVTFSYGQTGTPTNTTRTANFSFTIRTAIPDDLAANSFWIEAEDWDIGGGQSIASASTMPYGGGAYQSSASDTTKFGIDYHNDDGFDSQTYRSGGDLDVKDASGNGIQNVDTIDNGGGQFGEWRPGGVTLADDWRIGWINGGDWGNFTRTVPSGVYHVYAAMSWGGDPLGTPDREFGSLDVVTSGWGTANQGRMRLGSFDAPSSGTWGDSFLMPMQAPDGSVAAVMLAGTNTLKFNSDQGDFDWFVLSPTTSPPKVVSAAPGPNGGGVNQPQGYGVGVPRNTPIDIMIANLTTSVATNTIKLSLNGADITASSSISIVTPIAGGGTYVKVHNQPAAPMPVGTNTWTLSFSDTSSPAKQTSTTVSFLVDPRGTPGQFLIEAEDFDFNGGSTTNVASTMPYTGGAYNGLSAKFGVDYANNDNQESEQYRVGGDLHVGGKGSNMDPGPGDFDRGSWTNTVNHKIGWIDGADWFNYTRTFPAATYQVWVALSHGDAAGTAHDLEGTFGVVTSGVGTTNQVVQVVGSSDGPSSGSWGLNNLHPIADTNGVPLTVNLSGTQTVQFQGKNGDYDYLLLVPTTLTPPGPSISGIKVSGSSLIITWSGTATLQQNTGLTGTWTPVSGGSPATVPISGNKTLYFRLQQ